MSFVFFDTETTGLKHGFDQIVHFAAILTDNDLNEVGRFEVRSRLLPHIVPHPGALRTNGISIAQLTDKNLPSHYEMVMAIRRQLSSWSPSIFVGYNSIRFDEEMLRHAFFQTLNPTFLTSNHGNCRADALGLMMVAAALSPACLVAPVGLGGRPVFRLEQLALANGIPHTQSHDAMADVIATLALCRCVRERSSDLWQRFVRFSKKATVADFVDAEDGFFLTEFFRNEAYHSPVVCMGEDPEKPNGRLCLRLDVDIESLGAMDEENLRTELAAKPSPIRSLRINAAPALTPFYDAPDLMLNGLDVDELESRARWIKDNRDLCSRLISSYMTTREPPPVSLHVEARIYEGFPGDEDVVRMASFHDASWPEAFSIVQSLDDERLKVLGLRLIYFAARSILPDNVRLQVERDLTDRLFKDTGAGLTLQQALQETNILLGAGGVEANGILNEYKNYLITRIQRVAEFRSQLGQ